MFIGREQELRFFEEKYSAPAAKWSYYMGGDV